MSTASLITLVVLALGLALQPWSVIAAVLLAASTDGTRRAAAFALGWFLALSVVAVATVALAPGGAPASSTSTALSVLDLTVGVLLALWLLVRIRRGRRAAGEVGDAKPAEMPKWMARIDTMPTLVAFGLGAFLPTYILVVSAMSQLLQSGLSGAGLFVAATLFVVVASLGVTAPLLVLLVRHDEAPAIHERWRGWLIANHEAVMGWILGAIAVLLSLKGLAGLLT